MKVAIASHDAHHHAVSTPAGAVTLALETCTGGRVRCESGGRIVEAVVIERPGEISVQMDGLVMTFAVPDHLAGSEDEAAGEDHIVAPMPGLVKHVKAAAGRTIKKGDPLVVLEAMKMEHTLTAPRDGRIAEVFVAAGDLVTDGAVLARLEG